MIREAIYKMIHRENKFINIYINIINLGTGGVLRDSGRKFNSTKEVKRG
jgi:hypothetical protein